MKKTLFLVFLIASLFGREAPKRVTFSKEEIAATKKIKHLIIIFQENWSFDGLLGTLPGVDGIANASEESKTQLDLTGAPYPKLPPSIDTKTKKPYPQIPQNLLNGPYNLGPYIPPTEETSDLYHRYYQEQYQINGGKMNKFALWSNAWGFAMSYYDLRHTELAKLAQEFTICDRWFHSCYGGSLCNVLWLFSAQMPVWPNAPKQYIAKIIPSGALRRDGKVSPNGYLINDAEPFYPPHKKEVPDHLRVPPIDQVTIGDRLSEKNISWKWYAQEWKSADAGHPHPSFVFHHQAPLYYKPFAPGSPMRKKHLADLTEFYDALDTNTLPAVSFVRSLDIYSFHPGHLSVMDGAKWLVDTVHRVQKSPVWEDCLIIITFDENGGRWDHVAPPEVDPFGPGTRVPALIISPYVKKGYVDSTSYETVSILKFIEERWGLEPLSTRDRAANNILNSLILN
ncbi:alkaline phosphatase family protein [Candidatus Neptunochlamydia vexilliferae]|uniref:Acid phosphatase n=1 Tax=Candidatus Neptunichlamydia vexilliferae TaxID=1651774 RepID=A0ABS0AXC9_9BACT|nr:alkaline phosphatase family protein [Candidatus Neptunochlamydia vexilliferae]MBF5058778.1 hypothetical protein [Candidatus Neptunochlamydia vexilliferae]